MVDKKKNHLSHYICEYVEVVQVCNLLSSRRHLVDVKDITGNWFIIENSFIDQSYHVLKFAKSQYK